MKVLVKVELHALINYDGKLYEDEFDWLRDKVCEVKPELLEQADHLSVMDFNVVGHEGNLLTLECDVDLDEGT